MSAKAMMWLVGLVACAGCNFPGAVDATLQTLNAPEYLTVQLGPVEVRRSPSDSAPRETDVAQHLISDSDYELEKCFIGAGYLQLVRDQDLTSRDAGLPALIYSAQHNVSRKIDVALTPKGRAVLAVNPGEGSSEAAFKRTLPNGKFATFKVLDSKVSKVLSDTTVKKAENAYRVVKLVMAVRWTAEGKEAFATCGRQIARTRTILSLWKGDGPTSKKWRIIAMDAAIDDQPLSTNYVESVLKGAK